MNYPPLIKQAPNSTIAVSNCHLESCITLFFVMSIIHFKWALLLWWFHKQIAGWNLFLKPGPKRKRKVSRVCCFICKLYDHIISLISWSLYLVWLYAFYSMLSVWCELWLVFLIICLCVIMKTSKPFMEADGNPNKEIRIKQRVVLYYHCTGHRQVSCTANLNWRNDRHLGSCSGIEDKCGLGMGGVPVYYTFYGHVVRCDGCLSSARSFCGLMVRITCLKDIWGQFVFTWKISCAVVCLEFVRLEDCLYKSCFEISLCVFARLILLPGII